ncbi:sodium-translocating pyrophosphatase [Candidatus Bathyarchaeota archaeon]|nr:sodium-translocating pyrophosphatase [Candidatus Bathyarchaeota archaeon]
MDWLTFVPVSALASIIFAGYLYHYVNRQDSGSDRMREIADAIRIGANAYLRRQNSALAVFAGVMAVILGLAFSNLHLSLAYLLGALCTAAASYFGMNAAVRANVRTANGAVKGLSRALPVAYFGGAVMGLSIVGIAVLGMSILFYIYSLLYGDMETALDTILGFSFGASSLALFAKAGGGIYTKTADIGADLVGKVELGIPEDDPRNPAVIADNVGDNVGDVAGMGADLTDSYIAGTIAAMLLGARIYHSPIYIVLPLMVKAIGVVSSMLGTLFVRFGIRGSPGSALNRGTYAACIIFSILLYVVISLLNLGGLGLGIFSAIIAGLVAGIIMGLTTDFFTSIDRGPVKRTAESSKTGAAINILSGFSYGLLSIIPPMIGIVVAILAAWNISDIFGLNHYYGISMAAVGMLAVLGSVIAADAYGPIADNAKGIAEQSGLGEEVIEVIDRLDAAGNTTKAISKGFAIGAAALQVLALFFAYSEEVKIPRVINLMDPNVLGGILIGAMMPPVLSALLILAVGKNAFRMVEEVRRQFREIPGLMEGRSKPDYARCVDIATAGALKELILPGILSISVPILVGFTLGKQALAGFLGGCIITGIIFALMMANSGGMWDNAKKYIEEGHFGGKGSEAHKAAVVGDTVGDPFKDTAGPSLNTMITVMALSATVFAPFFL